MIYVFFPLIACHILASPVSASYGQVAIGSGTTDMSENERRSTEGCQWFGSAFLCDGACPASWLQLHRSAIWKLRNPKTNEMHNDHSFGYDCLFGDKAFCCPMHHDIYWTGTYTNTINLKFSCSTISGVPRSSLNPLNPRRICGLLTCHNPLTDNFVEESVEIGGILCNTVMMNGRKGINVGGQIQWASASSNYTEIVDRWMKLS